MRGGRGVKGDKLVQMANQIASFFANRSHAEAVAEARDHIVHFWSPAMRRDLVDHLARGGAGADPIIIDAVAELREAVKRVS